MRHLFFLPQTRHTPGHEWGLDLIQQLLDAGDEVLVLVCDGEAASCEINLRHRYSVCHKCIQKRAAGMRLLKGNFKTATFLKLSAGNRREIAELPREFESLDALKRYKFDVADLGMAVASSMISCTRDPQFDLRAHRETVAALLQSAVAVYRSIQNYLSESHFDRVYVFNGRIATFRALFRAAQSKNVPCHMYEAGSSIHRIQWFINHLPHEIAYNNVLMRRAWDDAASDPAAREQLARAFYEKATAGKALISFISGQKDGTLPEGFDETRHNVAVFNSSEDELSAVGSEWNNPIYAGQTEGLIRISQDAELLAPNTTLYLRIHPHLKGVDNAVTRSLRGLNRGRFVVIPPESPVSSYALLRNCRSVLTFGSTMGIEAVYHGKPSILAAQSFYRELGGTYNPATHEEVLALLQTDLAPKPIDAALLYGYYYETYGEPFKYFAAKSYDEGTFKGKKVSYGRHWDYIWGVIDKLPCISGWLNRRSAKRSAVLLTAQSR